MKLKHKILTAGLMALTTSVLFAQNTTSTQTSTTSTGGTRELDKWSVGVNAGVLLFYGDIRQYDFYPVTTYESEWGFGYGLTVNRSFSPAFSLQGQLLNGTLSGSRARLRGDKTFSHAWGNRDVYFTADVFETSINAIINLSNLTIRQRSKPRKFSVYALVGLGLASFKTELKEMGSDVRIADYGYTVDERTTETVVPVGLGLKYKLSSKLDLGIEGTMRNLNSDKLDATNTSGTSKDKYSYTDITLTYKFGESADKNEWVNPLDALTSDMNTLKAKVEGLTSDTDKDGVADTFDKDSSTPDGVKVYGDGTAVDTDGDGVADAQDSDPFTTKGAKVDSKGKESDSDGDGVPDSKDLEANTKAGALVNFQGKAIEVSKGEPADASAAYLPSVYFQSGSSSVQYKYYENLATIARALKANPSLKLTIIGHTDATGSDKINEKLGQKRAEAVSKHLQTVYGIEASRMNIQTKGKADPIAKGNASMNRRVDFKVSK